MTIEIPKRPTAIRFDMDGDCISDDQMIDHEHAVALVAVEALTRLAGSRVDENLRYTVANEALAKIEASGWLP